MSGNPRPAGQWRAIKFASQLCVKSSGPSSIYSNPIYPPNRQQGVLAKAMAGGWVAMGSMGTPPPFT